MNPIPSMNLLAISEILMTLQNSDPTYPYDYYYPYTIPFELLLCLYNIICLIMFILHIQTTKHSLLISQPTK
jgi:hypothetical protein